MPLAVLLGRKNKEGGGKSTLSQLLIKNAQPRERVNHPICYIFAEATKGGLITKPQLELAIPRQTSRHQAHKPLKGKGGPRSMTTAIFV